MSPMLGEIRMFAGNFAPVGWALCDGQLLAIAENEPLFNLIGTQYGGDGADTFALPDLRGRVPVHQVAAMPPTIPEAYPLGSTGGVEQVTLSTEQIPAHRHRLLAATGGGAARSPAGRLLASPPTTALYVREQPAAALPPQALDGVGDSQPHDNMGPSLAITYIIALSGDFPSST